MDAVSDVSAAPALISKVLSSSHVLVWFFSLDEDQLMSMFGNDSETCQKQQESNRKNSADATRASSASNAGGSDNWTSERGRTPGSKQNDPSTPSDSNSVSEVSNEDPKGGLGKYKSEPDVQSSGDHEGGTQTFSKGELQQALAGLDSSLDPKRAKRWQFHSHLKPL